MTDYKQDYNTVYGKRADYGCAANWREKDPYVLKYFKDGGYQTILDAGCGRGHYLSLLGEQGLDVFGIEVSDVCCSKHLKRLPHKCSGIVEYSQEGHRYDAILCTDVLEHINPQEIDTVIAGLKEMAPHALLGIANHRDRQFGIDLHLIIEDEQWWLKKLEEHYPTVSLYHKLSNKFFFISVSDA